MNRFRFVKLSTVKLIIFFFLLIVALLYMHGAVLHAAYVNRDMDNTDQGVYLNETEEIIMRENRNFWMVGRNRMPVFHFLLSLIYDADKNKFFFKGKLLNITLSLLYLSILFFIFQKKLSTFSSINLILITAFTVFIFRSPYVQAEITFYFLFFVCFLLLSSLLVKPSPWLSILVGTLAGITHLTKASALPLLIVFILLSSLKLILKLIGKNRQKFSKTVFLFISLSLFVLSFLFTTGPYLYQSKKIFGSYFYNVNSTFYLWYDSWEEAKKGTFTYNDMGQYPNIPGELLPSPQKYFREHNFNQIKERLNHGKNEVLSYIFNINHPYWKEWIYGYGKYFLVILIGLFIGLQARPKKIINFLRESHLGIIFFLAVFIVYAILICWYTSIASGNRFVLTLFLPTIFFLYSGFSKINEDFNLMLCGVKIKFVNLFNSILFLYLCYDIYTVLTFKIFFIKGGP